MPQFFPSNSIETQRHFYEEFRIEIQVFLKEFSSKKPIAAVWNSPRRSVEKQTVYSLFKFNPNEASKEDFIKLGLSNRVSQTIINYRNKGGKFFEKEDVKKIYGLRKEDYERLKPYMIIEKENSKKEVQFAENQLIIEEPNARMVTQQIIKANDKTSDNFYIDINKATIEDWKKLKGIGDYFSKKIVKFRDALGGFVSIDQIAQTYNLPDSTFQNIKPHLRWSELNKKIKINEASIDELKGHPYLKFKQAKGIVTYRDNHGNFENIRDLKKIGGALTEEIVLKIEPYLSFE